MRTAKPDAEEHADDCQRYAFHGNKAIDVKLACECAQYVGTSSPFKYVRVEDGLCHLSRHQPDSSQGWVQVSHCTNPKTDLPQCKSSVDKQDIADLKRCCVRGKGFVMSDACLADVREMQSCIDHTLHDMTRNHKNDGRG